MKSFKWKSLNVQEYAKILLKSFLMLAEVETVFLRIKARCEKEKKYKSNLNVTHTVWAKKFFPQFNKAKTRIAMTQTGIKCLLKTNK